MLLILSWTVLTCWMMSHLISPRRLEQMEYFLPSFLPSCLPDRHPAMHADMQVSFERCAGTLAGGWLAYGCYCVTGGRRTWHVLFRFVGVCWACLIGMPQVCSVRSLQRSTLCQGLEPA